MTCSEARGGEYSGTFSKSSGSMRHARREWSPAYAIAGLPDPVEEVIDGFRLPNGLDVHKVRVPLGVITLVYEARPNVTIDAPRCA